MDRESLLREADNAERKLQLFYREMGVPFVLLKLLDNVLVVRCEIESDVPSLCGRVMEQYTPRDGETLN